MKKENKNIEVMKLQYETEKPIEISFYMVPYILRNREKVVRSGNSRVIMKDPRYVVVSVRRDPKSGMLFGTAYDSRSANEYEIVGPKGWQKNWNFEWIRWPHRLMLSWNRWQVHCLLLSFFRSQSLVNRFRWS